MGRNAVAYMQSCRIRSLSLGVLSTLLLAASVAWGAPNVTGTFPAAGGTVPAPASVEATFNEDMDPATVSSGSFNVTRFPGIRALAGGTYHALVVRNDGTVSAWGMNDYGQCNVPSNLNGVTGIAGGYAHTLAVKSDGTLVAWGMDVYGQTTVPPAAQSGIVAVAAGFYHSAALRSDGAVVVWGSNAYGQCNVPTAAQSGVVAISSASGHIAALKADGTVVDWGSMGTPAPPGLPRLTAIAAGAEHTAGLTDNGAVVAWGNNYFGQLNVPIAARSGVVAIVAGGNHTVAVKGDGTVVSWGASDRGQTSVPPEAQSGVVSIGTGFDHSLALKTDGRIVFWGDNSWSQSVVPPVASGISVIATSPWHALAMKNDGTVVAGGKNEMGGATVPAGLSWVSGIAAGWNHSLALQDNGTVVAWGSNAAGQGSVPADLPGAVAVSAGASHSLALLDDGSVAAWGSNSAGQGTVPAGLSGGVAVSAGTDFNLTLKSDGSVVAWGANNYGQTNVPVEAQSGVVAISAGSSHALALKGNGTVVAWGWNNFGQSSVPPWLSGVKAISAGGSHSVALVDNGTVVAWGFNGNGQTAVPAGLSGVVAINAGNNHTDAVKKDGTVVSWGPPPLRYFPYSVYETKTEGTVAYDVPSRTISFTPSVPLEPGGPYYATVNTGVRNTSGVPMAADFVWNFTVAYPMFIHTLSLPDGSQGNVYSQAVVATGGTTPYTWSIVSGSLPPGLAMNPASGIIGGTPTSTGSFDFTVQVVDVGGLSDSRPLSITIPALAVITPDLADGYEGTPYSQSLVAAGGFPPYTWVLVSGSLPRGLSFANATGVLTGTPASKGNSILTFEVRDAAGGTSGATLTLSIYDLPRVAPNHLSGGWVDTPYSETLSGTGGKLPYTWSIASGNLPPGLSLDGGTGAISGTPTAAGDSSFTVRLADANGMEDRPSKSIRIR